MNSWELTTLGDFAPFKYGKGLPASKRIPGAIPVVGSGGISGWHDTALISKPVIVIGRKGTVGSVQRFASGAFPIDTTFFIEENESRDFNFTYYLLSTLGLEGMNSDSAVPGLNRDRAHSVEVLVPPLPEQRRIAGVLGTLDDLIDTNEKIASELDALVNALGRQFVELTMVDAEMIPLSEAARIAKGYSYKSDELKAGGDWLVNLKNVGRSGQFKAEGLKPLSGHRAKPSHIVEHGDVLVALTDLTQAREVIARPIRVRRRGAPGQLVASLDLAIVRPLEGFTKEYLQAVLSAEDFRSHALGYCNGTTVLHLGAAALPNYLIPVPDQRKLLDFSYKVSCLHAASDDAIQAVHELRKTRDELLPLLMSGKIRVREAEELVKERVG